MSKKAGDDRVKAGSAIQELRALLAGYEQELSGDSEAAVMPRTSGSLVEESLMLVNGLEIDLRPSALQAYRPIKSPGIVDCCTAENADPLTFVHELKSGVFRVHPRRGKLSAGLIGPFSGPPPAGVFAVAQTTHASAPLVRFHVSLWTGEFEPGVIQGQLGDMGQNLSFVAVEPGRQAYLIATATPPPASHTAESDSSSPWGILLATMAEPPKNFEFAWADFSTVALMFPSAEGADVAVLI